MAYCTQADLERRYGEQELIDLSDRSGNNAVDTQVVAEAIADAEALIDSYLEQRYRSKMPFSPVPTVLERIACSVARYNLYSNSIPEAVQKAYDAAVDFLKAVVSGKASLGADEQPPASGGLPQMESDGRIFGRSDSEGFI